MADIDGLCPNALFSALAPHTQIPPHHGETNARLVAHLPLIIPKGCSYRVGHERREWEVGKCLIFDDTLEHEARNDSDELRVVLIFDLWNPLLNDTEKKLVSALAKTTREFGITDTTPTRVESFAHGPESHGRLANPAGICVISSIRMISDENSRLRGAYTVSKFLPEYA